MNSRSARLSVKAHRNQVRRMTVGASIGMGLPILLLVFLGCTQPGIANALATIGRSDDPWEGKPEADPRLHMQCGYLDDPYFMEIPAGSRATAISRLGNSSVVPLDNVEAAELLDIKPRPGINVATQHFFDVIDSMNAARRSVYETQTGSWSMADQIVLDGLEKITFARSAGFRPYLVRALKASHASLVPFNEYRVQMCGGIAAPDHISDGDLHLPPERSALIIFSDKTPTSAFVRWAVPDQSSAH